MSFTVCIFSLDHDDILNGVSRYFIEHGRFLKLVLVVWEADIELVDRYWLLKLVYGLQIKSKYLLHPALRPYHLFPSFAL